MTLHSFLLLLGDPIDGSTPESIYEAIFPLFAHRPPPKSLGFIDRKSTILSVTVNDREFKINQSPTLLGSQRERGTTGAVLWSITPPLATFLTSLTSPLAIHGIISPQSTILELGTGVSSIIGLSLAIAAPLNTRPARIILSDQEYVLKLARKNIEENLDAAGKWEKVRDDVKPTFASYKVSASPAGRKNTRESARFGRSAISKSRTNSGLATGTEPSSRHPGITIDVISLDWEEDSIWHHPAFSGRLRCPISLVLVVDCIYNESLIAP
ncbi:hypothetical protein BDZ91DRAFT_14884 [Kalaharituber pfeilii]|nr:hypothetical protein BDZ91DRAFT_14884 [Kalaharituber pfeilii]